MSEKLVTAPAFRGSNNSCRERIYVPNAATYKILECRYNKPQKIQNIPGTNKAKGQEAGIMEK